MAAFLKLCPSEDFDSKRSVEMVDYVILHHHVLKILVKNIYSGVFPHKKCRANKQNFSNVLD